MRTKFDVFDVFMGFKLKFDLRLGCFFFTQIILIVKCLPAGSFIEPVLTEALLMICYGLYAQLNRVSLVIMSATSFSVLMGANGTP